MDIANKPLTIRNIAGPLGVRGRNSDNRLIAQKLGWAPSMPLQQGIAKTYAWVNAQVEAASQLIALPRDDGALSGNRRAQFAS